MVDRIIKDLRLSNLRGKKVRDTRCLLFMDENCGPNDIELYKLKKENEKKKVTLGKNFYDLPMINKIKDEDYQKYNNLKEMRLPQPYRDYENTTDTLSHFLTPGYDKNRYLNPTVKIEPVMEPNPLNSDPSKINSLRTNCPNIFEELNRQSAVDRTEVNYHEGYQSADACKAKLHAMQREALIDKYLEPESNKRITFFSNAFQEFTPQRKADATEDDLNALKYMYTSTTQKMYEDIPFKSYLNPRRWAPISTKEAHADPVGALNESSKCYPAVNTWGRDVDLNRYDAAQLRTDRFLSPKPHDFCAKMKRVNHIPTYSGCINTINNDDIDNPYVKDIKPMTNVRSAVPKFSDCVERSVFVGYTGKIPHLPANLATPFHTDPIPRNVLGQPC